MKIQVSNLRFVESGADNGWHTDWSDPYEVLGYVSDRYTGPQVIFQNGDSIGYADTKDVRIYREPVTTTLEVGK